MRRRPTQISGAAKIAPKKQCTQRRSFRDLFSWILSTSTQNGSLVTSTRPNRMGGEKMKHTSPSPVEEHRGSQCNEFSTRGPLYTQHRGSTVGDFSHWLHTLYLLSISLRSAVTCSLSHSCLPLLNFGATVPLSIHFSLLTSL